MSTYVAASRASSKSLENLFDAALVNPIAVNGLVVVCLTLLFTVSDAFETGHLSLAHQVSLWLTFSLLLVIQLCYLHRIFLARLSATFLLRVLAIGLSIAVTILLMTVELHLLKYTPLLPKQPDPFFEFLFFISKPVLAASALVLMSQLIPIQQQIKAYQLQALQALKQSSNPQELDNLIANFPVQHVQAHDHYLEISCDEQRFFVRGRMQDALAQLINCDGLQVHRSHWVARQNIRRIQRQGRDIKLLLLDNTVIPVARSRAHLLDELH